MVAVLAAFAIAVSTACPPADPPADRLFAVVTINPEGRVRVDRGPHTPPVTRGRTATAVVKVVNQCGGRPRLTPLGRYAGGSNPFSMVLAGGDLTGQPVEYRELAIRCDAAGRHELTVGFEAGQGTQDLGFRGEVPVLLTVRERQPNVVLIVADDLGYGALGCYGQQKVKTPHLDALAASGTRFTQAYAGCCQCAPSRSVLMTGLHTGHTRVRTNGGGTLLPADVTVAARLKAAGYACGGFGKWGLGDAGSPGDPARHGFDEWTGYLDQVHAHAHYPDWLWQRGQKVPLAGNEQKAGKRQTYAPDVIHGAALDFVRRHADRPFFCYLATTIPHAELLVPADSTAGYDFPETPYVGDHYASNPRPRATYAGMVSRLDRDVGRLVALLKEKGIDRDTLVLFTSDNGPINAGGADPAFFANAGPLRGLKFSLFEGGIRVPMIAAWPGRVPAGRVSEHVWGFDDVLPTACEVAGVPAPPGGDGVSVLPTLLGAAGQQAREQFYWESPSKDGLIQAMRVGGWKAVRQKPGAALQLFDLTADPGETTDLAGRRPDEVARLEAAITAAHRPPGK